MPRPFLSVLLLAALIAALATFWDSDSALNFKESEQRRTLAKTYLVNTRALTYDQEGYLTEILEASSVRHFPSQKHSLLADPRYYSQNGNNRTWSVTSDKGRLLDKLELLFLEGNVILTDDENEGHLYTETMQINLRKKMAISRVPVTFSQGLNRTTAKGMVADLNKEQIRLISDVESIYAPAVP